MADSLSSHIVDFSRSLIDDIELSRLPAGVEVGMSINILLAAAGV
jgi:hypothetical protein